MSKSIFVAILLGVAPSLAHADIFRWDNGQLIPGTQGKNPQVNANLSGLNLEFANLQSAELTGATFAGSNLRNARITTSFITNTNLSGATIQGVDFSSTRISAPQLYSTASYEARDLQNIVLGNADALESFIVGLSWQDMRNWDLSGQNLTKTNLGRVQIAGADLTDAIMTESRLLGLTGRGFTKEQLYSTASYKNGNLRGIDFRENDMSGWNLSGQDLSGALFRGFSIVDAPGPRSIGTTPVSQINLSDAIINNIDFQNTGLTAAQLVATRSYQNRNLRGVTLPTEILPGLDLHQQDLTSSNFSEVDLRSVNLQGATLNSSRLMGSNLSNMNLRGIQLARADLSGVIRPCPMFFCPIDPGANLTDSDLSQANLQNSLLTGAVLRNNKLIGADLRGASFEHYLEPLFGPRTDLQGADFTDALIQGANFSGAGLTKEQLYSTASYKQGDLRGIIFGRLSPPGSDLSGWNFREQNLTGAFFSGPQFVNATGTDFTLADLTDAHFDGAVLQAASFIHANLRRADLSRANLASATLVGASLIDAQLNDANLENAVFRNADARGASGLNLTAAQQAHMITPDGQLHGLSLVAGEELLLRDVGRDGSLNRIALHSDGPLSIPVGSQLSFELHPTTKTTLSFEGSATLSLGGKLNLVPYLLEPGTSFQIFDFDALEVNGQFEIVRPELWDAQQLFTGGTVTFKGVMGDFNRNLVLDAEDLDLLNNAIAEGQNPRSFEVNGDAVLDQLDRLAWVRDIKRTFVGDANLDGEFNSADLVAVFSAGLYETDLPATWSQGDWSGDQRFNTSDFVEAFANGGYEQGPRQGIAAVPEPTSASLLTIAVAAGLAVVRRRQFPTPRSVPSAHESP